MPRAAHRSVAAIIGTVAFAILAGAIYLPVVGCMLILGLAFLRGGILEAARLPLWATGVAILGIVAHVYWANREKGRKRAKTTQRG